MRGEMNQDAADQCISASKTAMAVGDWDKAIRLLDKAIRLCPDNAVRSAPCSRLRKSSPRSTAHTKRVHCTG